jgi:hypothetical protein
MRLATAGTAIHAVSKQPTAKFADHRPTQASAAAGQLTRKQRAPSPPTFRAGFSYERAQTPDSASRAKEQQRLAQHKAFKAAQPCSTKRAGTATAVVDAGQAALLTLADTEKPTGTLPNPPVLGTVPGNCTGVGNGCNRIPELQLQQPQQMQPSAAGGTVADNSTSTSAQGSTQHSTAPSSSGSAAVPADAAAPPTCTPQHNLLANNPVSMQPLPLPLNLQPQQQQSSTSGHVTNACKPAGPQASTSSSDGGGHVMASPPSSKQHRRRSSAGEMLSTSPGRPAVPNPIVGSQSLLHAMAAGYSQQALHRCVCIRQLGLIRCSNSITQTLQLTRNADIVATVGPKQICSAQPLVLCGPLKCLQLGGREPRVARSGSGNGSRLNSHSSSLPLDRLGCKQPSAEAAKRQHCADGQAAAR